MINWPSFFHVLALVSFMAVIIMLVYVFLPRENRRDGRLHAATIVESMFCTLYGCIADELGGQSHVWLILFLLPCLFSLADLAWLWQNRQRI
ncbi:MAG: hypothetical protein C3F02_02350 [Parcubacteria group bacterium]|nr:MAG: hypothetical protein C3F02_02350 [Parcubacteria group bacterium]